MNKAKFIGWLTSIVVLIYIGAAAIVFSRDGMTWQEFSAAVGPIAGLLIGYWVRGDK